MFRILVIDDEKHIRDNIAEILEYGGYDVLKAEHGAMGIRLAREALPDLIICDIAMPGLDGLDVIQALRSDPLTAVLPFLFLTAQVDHASMRQAMSLGADDYLTKPFVAEEVLSAVRARIDKRAVMSQQFDALRSNLMTVLPHELRTPLSIILGYGELILMDCETMDRGDIESMVGTIVRSGERLQRVIENYLLYAQTELQRSDNQAKEAFTKGQFEMPGPLIREVASQTARAFERADDLNVRTENVAVQISGEMLKKIVGEIIDNAFKFSTAGTKIDIIGEQRGARYRLQVNDQGRGMTVEQIRRIGAYMQFERKLYEQQGLGLGLILAKRLAELHGGDLTIISGPGQGTTVSMILQLAL